MVVTDFGEANLPKGVYQKTELHAPMLVRPLDTILGYPVTSAVDIWTMWMTIVDIMGRSKLFEDFSPDKDSIILDAITTLGPIPFKMLRACSNHSKFFKEDGFWLEDRKPVKSDFSSSVTDRLRECMKSEPHYQTFGHCDAELQSLEKSLRSMLQYEPNNRTTVNQILSSEWVQDYGIPALLKSVPDVDLSMWESKQTFDGERQLNHRQSFCRLGTPKIYMNTPSKTRTR